MTSTTKAPEVLLQELKSAAMRLTDSTGNKVTETGEPLLGSDGRIGVSVMGEKIRLAIGTEFGSVVYFLDFAGACDLGTALIQRAKEVILTSAVQAEKAMTNPPIN